MAWMLAAQGTEWSTEDDDAETQLAIAARAGDRKAFLALYDRYVHRIEGYVRYRVSDAAEVEDLVSQIFMQALAHIDRFDPARGSFGAWLFAIARNAIRNHYRRKARTLPVLPGTTASDDPLTQALWNERLVQVYSAVSMLSHDQQDALAMRYGAELPFAQIAAALNRSEPAAKMLVQRALAALRRQIRQEGPS